MTHHLRTGEELTAFVDGRLAAAPRREVERHLEVCDECREWVATYRLVAESLATPAAPAAEATPHLESDLLCRFALADAGLDEMTRQRCSRHVESCPECADEVALVRAGAAEAREAGAGRRTAALRAPLAWAAALLVVAGVALVTRGIDRVPVADTADADQSTVQTGETILVEAMRVEAGTDLTLKAGSTVAFGDGFLVDSGGTLSVVIENGHDS